VALQGTLETFALPDVLRLLASTKKTGVLRIDTDRGRGELLVVDGELTGGAADGSPLAENPSDVLFEMLRSTDGSFLFDADADASGGGSPQGVEAALELAEQQLAEWREIEAVVPSPHRLVTICTDRGDDDITLSASQWQAIAALAGGCTVETLGTRLGLTELPTARVVRDLVDLRAVTLSDTDVEDATPAPLHPEPAAISEPAPAAAFVEPAPEPVDVAAAPAPSMYEPEPAPLERADSYDAGSYGSDSYGSDSHGADAGGISFASAPSHEPEPLAPVSPLFGSAEPAPAVDPAPEAAPAWDASSSFAAPSSSFFDDDDEDDPLADDPFGPDPFRIPRLPSAPDAQDSSEAAEMARQLANLSPRAAQAVAAAAAATSDQEREEALAQASDESEEPLNRGLLLKFLSSVDE
jgi:hypothetical protein